MSSGGLPSRDKAFALILLFHRTEAEGCHSEPKPFDKLRINSAKAKNLDLMRFDKQNRQLLEGQGLPCPQVGAHSCAPLQTRHPLPDLIVKIHQAAR